MKTYIKNINKRNIWLTIDYCTEIDGEYSEINHSGFVCYFKYSEPTLLNLGELLRDKTSNVILSENAANALKNAELTIEKR